MKYFVVSGPRCGSHYCSESIAFRTQVLPLGECLNSMYKNNVFTFENNQVQRHSPSKIPIDQENNSSILEINNRLDNLFKVDNWQGQAHIGQIEHLGNLDDKIEKIVNNTNAILLYRENFIEGVISWLIAWELEIWVPRDKRTYKEIYYNKEKHLHRIEFLLNEYNYLKSIANKYNWYDVFKYEDFTGDHNLDFKKYELQPQTNTWDLPVKNNTEANKKKLIKNLDELKRDLKCNGMI